MIDLFNYRNYSSWFIYLILILIIIIIINKNQENFILMPWNMSTRHYPMYDIRGYPPIHRFLNQSVNNFLYPFMYLTPYNYSASGEYIIKPIKRKKIRK